MEEQKSIAILVFFQHVLLLINTYLVYYQVPVWLESELDPENCGWNLIDNELKPIQTLLLPLLQENFLVLFISIPKRVVIIVAIENFEYFVHQYILIIMASLASMLNQIQHTFILII